MTRFPFATTHRSRRLRATPALRSLVRETTLSAGDLIYPLFAVPGSGVRNEISSMPGIFHLSIDKLVDEARKAADAGVPGVLLFGLPESKDEVGSGAYAVDGIVQRATEAVKDAIPDLLVITDVCLCEYTSHGHCGLLDGQSVDNDSTLSLLAKAAVSHANAGADIVAPSDMMDFRVAAIRHALDDAGRSDVPILSYAAKYASSFYGPFREAAQSTPAFGDRRAYQMDSANIREAIKEVEQDIAEGADMVMVKPALAYLDVIRAVREITHLPVAAYNISGEYAMVKAAAANGWIDERNVTLEILTGMRRAGADIIITYHAVDVARWLA
ncbi:MAG TPA: porphobilinogen synthase [Capsulimonadaceae bacterium]